MLTMLYDLQKRQTTGTEIWPMVAWSRSGLKEHLRGNVSVGVLTKLSQNCTLKTSSFTKCKLLVNKSYFKDGSSVPSTKIKTHTSLGSAKIFLNLILAHLYLRLFTITVLQTMETPLSTERNTPLCNSNNGHFL